MHSDTTAFLDALLSRCNDLPRSACLTLTAIHPYSSHASPSRHVPLKNLSTLPDTLAPLEAANQQGWGAYFAVGLRTHNLGRWRRGGTRDVLALPALFADVDDASPAMLKRIHAFEPLPSCLVHSGGGYHLYWWLEKPLYDLALTAQLLRGIAQALNSDPMSPSQSLRLPGTLNTKPHRHNVRCR